ncbi:peptidoglycan recognition family protein [uncultured Intestinimonas sp.]|uniref:peptidoglycan recognition protein family protein n=1 Tax=uncultured Intestinimonas sp. TaxID=1689265 RepID=UPI002943EB47|nr:peptidoglycan recognition family protein [uncultured Intestinimonas sp.]
MEVHTGLRCHHTNYRRGRARPVSFLVFHYVGATGGAEANARYYHRTANIGASAHYFVGHGPAPKIWQSVPEADTAWHCGAIRYLHPTCRNDNSIGIELCCRKGPKGWSIDEATMDAGAALGRDIMARYGIPIDHVLRHYDVTGKLCPMPLIDEGEWADFKKRLEAETVTQEQFNDMMAVWLAQNRDKPAAAWAEETWEKAAAAGIFDGIAPQNPLTREQAALLLDRLGLI